ncbi:MAG TPA: restriction endonuclease subunit S [Anaerolineaceae bacterium]|jgi:type I restriction enzyme S subunit
MEKWILPDGWEWTTVRKVVKDTSTRNPSQLPDQQFYYIDISSIDNEKGTIKPVNQILGKDAPSRARKVVRKDDVIFATTRPYLKNIALVPEDYDNQICSTGFCVLRADEELIIPAYLYYLCRSSIIVDQLEPKMRGASYPAVSDNDVMQVEIPLPLVGIQEKIVQRIEAIFSELAEARRLHEKIVADTNRLMESVLAEMLPNPEKGLPEGWGALPLSQLASEESNQIIPSDHPSDTFNYWGLDAISEGQIAEPPSNYIQGSEVKSTCISFTPKDVLYSKLRPYLNKVIVPTVDGIGSTEWVVYRPNPKLIRREYLAFVMRTKWFVSLASGTSYGARMPRANKSVLREIKIPIPLITDPGQSLSIQEQIVERISQFSSDVDSMQKGNAQQQRLLVQLEQSILAQAFRGEL